MNWSTQHNCNTWHRSVSVRGEGPVGQRYVVDGLWPGHTLLRVGRGELRVGHWRVSGYHRVLANSFNQTTQNFELKEILNAFWDGLGVFLKLSWLSKNAVWRPGVKLKELWNEIERSWTQAGQICGPSGSILGLVGASWDQVG